MISIIYGFIIASGFVLACVYVRLGSVLWELQKMNNTFDGWNVSVKVEEGGEHELKENTENIRT